MAKRVPCVIATYRISTEEYVQMSVPILNSFPDAVDEAKAAAVDGIRRMLAEALAIGADGNADQG